MQSNKEIVAQLLRALGEAYRNDWSSVDGRTLRAQLDGLAGLLRAPDDQELDFDVELAFLDIEETSSGYEWAH